MEQAAEAAEAAPTLDPVADIETGPASEPVETASSPEPESVDPGFVLATPGEAREKKYVPYERFDEVYKERKQLLAMMDQQRQAPEPAAAEPDFDFDDPAQLARAAWERANSLEQQLEAERTSSQIKERVSDLIGNEQFLDPERARNEIIRETAYAIQNTGKSPDLAELVRSHRQREHQFAQSVIQKYRGRKESPDASAAASGPPSPPVVPKPPAKKPGWDAAGRRVRDRLLGR
jgi:hypothetical protein